MLLRDEGASAAAKASAGRTLLEHFGDDEAAGEKAVDEMTLDEINAEIGQRRNVKGNVEPT